MLDSRRASNLESAGQVQLGSDGMQGLSGRTDERCDDERAQTHLNVSGVCSIKGPTSRRIDELTR